MIGYEEALSIVLENALPLAVENVELAKLHGRILAEDIAAPFDLPLFDNSAVDGYGVHLGDIAGASEDSPVRLPLTAVLRAGDNGSSALQAASSMKILTGGMVPPGVEAVVMREYCQEIASAVLVKCGAVVGENIRVRGAEYKQGQVILRHGMRVTPPVVGMIATLGLLSAKVFEQPVAAVVSTGNELVAPGSPLAPGQIYDSNSYALAAALRDFGVDVVHRFHAAEDAGATEETMRSALGAANLVVSAGGVSVGDFDFITQACQDIGVQRLIWKIAIKPGKPVFFGTQTSENGRKLVFGLPGNPVSALVTLHLFVRPAIHKMMGLAEDIRQTQALLLPAILQGELRKRPDRMEFVRGVLHSKQGELVVFPTTGQDSHMLGGLCNANCLIHFPQDASRIAAGERVSVELLDWNF